jgi:dUTPase
MVLIDSMTPAVRVQRLHPAAQLPRYAHLGPSGDLAADLHSVAEVRLEPGETLLAHWWKTVQVLLCVD